MKSPPQELRLAAVEVSSYRANRSHPQAPFPRELWRKLAKLAQLHGVEQVAKVAQVAVGTLRGHVSFLPVAPDPVEFVECFVADRQPLGVKIGLESRSGDRMSIETSGLGVAELGLLVRDFLMR